MRKTYRPIIKKETQKTFRTNEKITVPEVRLIDEHGKEIGVMPTKEALQLAKDQELDLIEVSPVAKPPVVKLIDYGKFRYLQEKLAHKQKTKQKKTELKVIRLSMRIGKHDLDFRQNQSQKFLESNNKLKLEMVLKGRENRHKDLAQENINKFIEELNEKIPTTVEQPLTRQGNRFTVILTKKV